MMLGVGMGIIPVAQGYGEVQGPSQYMTLDIGCYNGCQETGAANCAEICMIPSYSGGTTAPAGTPSTGQLIPGFKNEYLLLAATALAVVVIVSR